MTQVKALKAQHSIPYTLGLDGPAEEISRFLKEDLATESDPRESVFLLVGGTLSRVIEGTDEGLKSDDNLRYIFAEKAKYPVVEQCLSSTDPQLYQTFYILLAAGKPEAVEAAIESVPADQKDSYIKRAENIAAGREETARYAARFAQKLKP